MGRQRRAGQQPAAAQTHEQPIERADLFDQFLGRRSLPGDHLGMVIGRDQRQSALGGETAPDLFAILCIAVVEDHFAAVVPGRLDLHLGRIPGHDDRRRCPQQSPGEGRRLGMIAG